MLKGDTTNILIKHLNDWYIHLRNGSIREASEVKMTVNLMGDGQEDDNILYYYALLEHWHMLLENKISKKVNSEHKSLLIYYYHYFQGLYNFSLRRYEDSLAHFEKAEKNLHLIEDKETLSEFYLAISTVFYKMDFCSNSISYLEKALMFFERQNQYQKECTECEILIAKNYVSLNQLDKAQTHINKAFEYSKDIEENNVVRKVFLYQEILNTKLNGNNKTPDSSKKVPKQNKAIYLLKR
ncbi:MULTISPECIES: hypothetical protein [Bacillota]|uniref:response regulator aspartate phosphatase n=1 Tax=Bacillota TaxID=1239 RepID=UPI0039EFAF3B